VRQPAAIVTPVTPVRGTGRRAAALRAGRPAADSRLVPGAGPAPAGESPAGDEPVPGCMLPAGGYGIPLAGAVCSAPVNVVTAPVGVSSVTRTEPCWTSTPFWMLPMYTPVTPEWLVAE